jgi:hypothetical protein
MDDSRNKAGQKEMKADLKEMEATKRANKEKMEATINSIQSEMEDIFKNQLKMS